MTNEKGEKSAVVHSSLLQLVREQVCSFISIQSFTAYAASNQDSSGKFMFRCKRSTHKSQSQNNAIFYNKINSR